VEEERFARRAARPVAHPHPAREEGEPRRPFFEERAAPAVMDRSVIDAAERIPDAESVATVGRLLREEGLLVGGSAGTAVAAAVRVARAGGLDGPVVVLLPDSWDRYLSTAWLRAL